MKKIGVLTYDLPHRKTYDTLCLLKSRGYSDVVVFGKAFHYKKNFKPLYSHRPNNTYGIHPSVLCKNFGFSYFLEDPNEKKLERDSVILVCGAGIIKEELLKTYKIINAHPGYIPNVRGLDAFKWAIYKNEPIGVTTHIIGDSIDAGYVIERTKIPILKSDTFHLVAQRSYELEIKMLVDSIEKISGNLEYIEPADFIVHKRMPYVIEKDIIRLFEKYKEKVGT